MRSAEEWMEIAGERCTETTEDEPACGGHIAEVIAAAQAEARAEALEEAAALCDAVVDDYRHSRTTTQWTAYEAALRIRALAAKDRRRATGGGS